MMRYDYTCDKCGTKKEVKRSINDLPAPVICPDCGNQMRRVYTPLGWAWGNSCWQFGEDGLGDQLIHNF